MEHLLHYVWKRKIFLLYGLQITTELPVKVIDTRLSDPNVDPNLPNAKLRIDDTLWVDNVEVRTVFSNWFHHGHDHGITCDSAILHIATEIDYGIYCTNGEPVP